METKNSRSIVANPKKLRSNAWIIDRDGPGRSIIRRACPVVYPIIARTDKHDVRYHPTNRASRQDRRRLHRQGRQRQVHDGLAPARQQVRIARLATSSSSFWGHPSNGSRSWMIATPLRGSPRRARCANVYRAAIARDVMDRFCAHPSRASPRCARHLATVRGPDRSTTRAQALLSFPCGRGLVVFTSQHSSNQAIGFPCEECDWFIY